MRFFRIPCKLSVLFRISHRLSGSEAAEILCEMRAGGGLERTFSGSLRQAPRTGVQTCSDRHVRRESGFSWSLILFGRNRNFRRIIFG
jgi:hypothetical protein